MEEPSARTLAGRYELTDLLATGGMGQVWRARDRLLHREVAVKLLRSEYTGDATFLARFRAEAQHAATLVHPHIAAVFDYGELPGTPTRPPVAYLVMELVEGESLADVLRREGRLLYDAWWLDDTYAYNKIPFRPATMPPDHVEEFGKNTPLGRPGEPRELAGVYVLLASDEGSYISGAVVPVTGGKPIL